MTVGDLRRRMTAAEKAGWIAFDRYRDARRRQNKTKGELLGKVGKKHARRR